MYVPAIGLWLVAADQMSALQPKAWARWLVPLGAVAICLVLGVVTFRRSQDWKSDITLFESALRVDAGSTDARYNLAVALLDAGDGNGARREWERTLAIAPGHTGAMVQLGTWHAQQGDLATAATYFERALAVDPRDVEARFNLALLFERLGRRAEAIRQYQEFLRSDPVDYPELILQVRERIQKLERD